MNPLVEYFRCPEHLAPLETARPLPSEVGYFRFGGAIGYGRQAAGASSRRPDGPLVDAAASVKSSGGKVLLPFDLSEVLTNLRHERYARDARPLERVYRCDLVHSLYYAVRPLLGVAVRKHLQRLSLRGWKDIPFPRWPVDVTVETLMKEALALVLRQGGAREVPFIWFWPEGAPGCAMVTHDIEGAEGEKFCGRLMDLDDQFGIKSAFQVVPDAPWSSRLGTGQLIDTLRARGFEVNVHDLSHDGHLFRRREVFLERAARINARGREFGSRGFRAGGMYRRQDWFSALDCSYDMSVPNVAHLEPQRGGCCTVMPFFIGNVLELPLTTSEDYTLFHMLGQYSTSLWQQQIDRILEQNGLVSLIVHPDYVRARRAHEAYTDLLKMLVRLRAEAGVWVALPSEIDAWWRQRREMQLVPDGKSWRVVGPGSERARVAYVRLQSGGVGYDVVPARLAA